MLFIDKNIIKEKAWKFWIKAKILWNIEEKTKIKNLNYFYQQTKKLDKLLLSKK